MHLYEVGVRSNLYHGKGSLTYSSSESIAIGSVVEVPLRNNTVLGVVLRKATSKPKARVKSIIAAHQVTVSQPRLQLIEWLQQYYPAPLFSIIQLFLPQKLYTPQNEKILAGQKKKLPPLSEEQLRAVDVLTATKSNTALLYGETGTGKTRVYIELAKDVIKKSRSALILVPEIGLSPQLADAFLDVFPDQVIVIHSGLSRATRDKLWIKIAKSSRPLVVVGPRSALFAPLHNIGLIVVDEAHDNGYKQDQAPYYETSRVAAKLAALTDSLCLYGSATPRISDFWHLKSHDIPIIRMQKPINRSILKPQFDVIDSKDRSAFTRSSIFSNALIEAIEKNIATNQQSLIFLNRRGTAKLLSCGSCGWLAACPNCDVPLTYHGDVHLLQCHLCGFKTSPPTSCPICNSTGLLFQRRGTKSLQAELHSLFPQARIERYDSDNKTHERLDKQYEAIKRGEVDILIGTQVLAKGLDIPNLTLVAIPLADSASYLPDYTSDEQNYQLLRQVIGRVGRTSHKSRVIIQSFNPDNPILRAVLKNDWLAFYQSQLEHRKKFLFPPFVYMLQLSIARASKTSASTNARRLAEYITEHWPETIILGPSPRFHEKAQGAYHWQLIIKARKRSELIEIINNLPSGWRHNIDPSSLL